MNLFDHMQHMKRLSFGPIYLGDLLIALLVILPLFIEADLLRTDLNLRFAAQLSGILSMSCFSVAAILSIRVPGLDQYFGGLVRLWSIHKLLGFLTLVSAYFHIWFIAMIGLQVSVATSYSYLFPSLTSFSIWFGWASLLLLIIFLSPSFHFFSHFDYQKWKQLHLLSIPAYFMALLHVFFLTQNKLLWSLYATGTGLSFFWRKALSKKMGRFHYEIVEIKKLAKGVVEIELQPKEKGLNFRPGQFVYLTPLDRKLHNGFKEEHPYTLSSSCHQSHLKIGIKALGDATEAIQSIRPHSQVLIEGPYGDFFKRKFPQKKQLWIAGGIGITPFISAFRSFYDHPQKRQEITLLYLAKDAKRAYYSEELRGITQRQQGLQLINHYHQEHGFLTKNFLDENVGDLNDMEIYICGPGPMIDFVIPLLLQQGVSKKQIHCERFNLL